MKTKTKGRHHASKNFKKYGSIQDCYIDTEAPTPDNMKVIEEYCKIWWNGLNTSEEIRKIIAAINCCKTHREKEQVLKPVYYIFANASKDFQKDVSRLQFTYTFILGLPIFKKWIAEEDRQAKQNITGMLEMDILNIFGDRKKIKKPEIYSNLIEYYRRQDIDKILDILCAKNALEKLPLTKWKEQYYELLAICDDHGWYIN